MDTDKHRSELLKTALFHCENQVRDQDRSSALSICVHLCASVVLLAYYDPVSSGKTFTSTRRFFLLCSELLGSVQPGRGLSQPLPTTLNLFGSNWYLSMMALRTASARS